MMGKKKNKQKELPPAPPKMEAPGTYLRENGVLYLNDVFDKDTIHPLVVQIHEFNLMPEELQPEAIKLHINSPGGAVNWGFQLVDAMRTSEIPIITIAQGLVASCGVITLMAGDKRIATHNTSIMSHVYSAGSGSMKEFDIHARHQEHLMMGKRMEQHYKKFTKKSVKYIRKHLLPAEDVWMTPEAAVEHGIIDEVWDTYR